jgi:ankyrin repeat protein
VEELLIHGKDYNLNVNVTDNEGYTALLSAVRENDNADSVKALLAYGVEYHLDVNVADNNGWTAFIMAACIKNTVAVQLLLAHGEAFDLDLNARTRLGFTALMYAAQNSPASVTDILAYSQRCTYNLDVNAQDPNGRTALSVLWTHSDGTTPEVDEALYALLEHPELTVPDNLPLRTHKKKLNRRYQRALVQYQDRKLQQLDDFRRMTLREHTREVITGDAGRVEVVNQLICDYLHDPTSDTAYLGFE